MRQLDPALTRPGRIDRTVSVPLPDQQGRLAVLRLHAERLQAARAEKDPPGGAAEASTAAAADPLGLSAVAEATASFSGAELANLVNEAALLAVRGQSPAAADDERPSDRHRPRALTPVLTARQSSRSRWRSAICCWRCKRLWRIGGCSARMGMGMPQIEPSSNSCLPVRPPAKPWVPGRSFRGVLGCCH
eukprot:SAG11_NODE_385_length_9888_cov_13.326387_5_plen_190_part_00